MAINKKIINNLLPLVALLLCLTFLYKGQLFVLKPTFLNFEGTGDIRAHIAKIELVRQGLVEKTGWPAWSYSSYLGYAPFQHYPPFFYIAGGLLAIIFTSFTSYKLLVLLNFILASLAFSFFIKRAINISNLWASWSGVVFSLSPPLLVLHLYGAEPNLMAWSIMLLVLGFYCWPKNKYDYFWAVLWFTVTILIHPYPVVFLGIILLTWAIIQAIANKPWYKPLLKLISLLAPAVILTIWWWLPALLTKDYLSPLADPFIWLKHNSFIVHLILLIAVVLAYFSKNNFFKNKSIVFIGLIWSCFLTWGGQSLIPLVGNFLHNSRFANLGITSFGLAVIIWVLYNNRGQSFNFNRTSKNLVVALFLFVILVLFIADSFINGELKSFHQAEFIHFTSNENITRLLPSLKDKRVIATTRVGSLPRADSLVTYAPFYNFQTVTGAYSQGDPKFFNFTVHLEWEERWLLHKQTLENLMGASAADYLYIHNPAHFWIFNRTEPVGYNLKLLSSPAPARPVTITNPALLDVAPNDAQLFTDIINLLLPDGYQLPLVNIAEVTQAETSLFSVVVGDNENIVKKYPHAKAYLIINNSITNGLLDNERIYFIKLNKETMRKYFYQGPKQDYGGWWEFDLAADKARYIQRSLDLLEPSKDVWHNFKNNYMISELVSAEITNKSININANPDSFVIIRQSWFPRWAAKQGKLWRTTQGFMLGYTAASRIELEFLNTCNFIKKQTTQKLLFVN